MELRNINTFLHIAELHSFSRTARQLGYSQSAVSSQIAQLEAELDSLKTEGRIDIAEKLKVARSYGDLSENSEYDEAKSEQAKIEARINELEYQLEHAEIIGATEKGSVSMGSKVTVLRKSDDVRATYEIVGFSQSNPAEGKISDESPVGRALMGAKIGETVTVEAPIGNIDYLIEEID